MVGSGRVAIEVVREAGKPLLGIDSSPAMLEAGKRAADGRFAFDAFVFSHTAAARLDGTTQDDDGGVHTLRYAPADDRIEVEALYGGFRREPYTDESLEMVWVARTP